jgi:nucleotide-binding universal stress UspA family protein
MALSQFSNRSWVVPPDIPAVKFSPDRAPRVLCASDLGVGSDAALSRTQEIARALDAQVLLLHVVDSASTAGETGRRRARAQLTVDALARKIAWPGGAVQGSVRASRRPHRAIADLAIEWDADLIVLGAYRQRLGDSFRGTVAERVIRRADRPVLVVNREATGPYEHVLLAAGLSPMSSNIARVCKQFVLRQGSRVSAVHAPQDSLGFMLYLARGSESAVSNSRRFHSRFASQQIEAHLERAGLNGVPVAISSPQTSPFHAIEQMAQRVGSDLVVIGSSRFPLLKRVFVGSVSNEVLRGIKQDVLLISPAAAWRARRRASTINNASVQTEKSAGRLSISNSEEPARRFDARQSRAGGSGSSQRHRTPDVARTRATAERVQEGAAKTARITFGAMALSLLAAIGGAMVGRKRAAKRLVENASVRAAASTVG